MIDLFDEFARVIRAFSSAEVQYARCGGMALAVYGIPRATVDMDFLILPESEEQVKKIAIDLGYKTEAEPMSLAQGKVKIRRFVKFQDVCMAAKAVTGRIRRVSQLRRLCLALRVRGRVEDLKHRPRSS